MASKASSSNQLTGHFDYETKAASWHDAHLYSPAPRHRRKLINRWAKKINFESAIDVGCGQPFLLQELAKLNKHSLAGADISQAVIENNKETFPHFNFYKLDIADKPLNQKFDLVIASEVLEHIKNWPQALHNLVNMTKRYLLITVPSSAIFRTDSRAGHIQHFKGPELIKDIEKDGLKIVRLAYWGFPFHTLYKLATNNLLSDKALTAYAEENYGWNKKLVSKVIDLTFFLNLNRWGYQLILLAEKKDAG